MAKKNITVEQTGEDITTEEMVTTESVRTKKGKKTSFRIRE